MFCLCFLLTYFLVEIPFLKTNFLKIYRTDLRQMFVVGRTVAVDERREISFSIRQNTLPWQPIFSATLFLQELHWLKVEQRIEYKLAVLVYRCLRGLAPPYLANDFRRVADLGTRRRLRSASTPALVVSPSRLSTVGDRSFPVAAARVWNSLPDFVTASTSLPMFKRHLKTVLFAKSY